MAYLADLLKIELTFPEGTYLAKLGNKSVKFKKKANKEYGFSTREISEVTFYNDDNTIYDKLYAYKIDRTTCVQILMQVYSISDDGTQTLRQTYELPVRIGSWDHDLCTVTLKPRLVHKYKCLMDTQTVELNLLNVPATETLSFADVSAEIQTKICHNYRDRTYSWNIEDMPLSDCGVDMAAEGWAVVENYLQLAFQDTGLPFAADALYHTEIDIRTTYARKFSATDPGGWIPVTGGFAQPVETVYQGATVERASELAGILGLAYAANYYEITKTWKTAGIDLETGDIFSMDNGVRMEDALNLYVQDCGMTLVSDFFDINADGTAPSNQAYDYAAAWLQDLLIFQASDVIRASAQNNATAIKLNFKDFFINLGRFNIEVVRSPGSNTVRIEHVSYRQHNRHLDLTTDFEIIKGKAKEKQTGADAPRFERFKDKYTTNSPDHDDAYIEYDALCSDDSDNNEKTYNAPHVITNVGHLYENDELAEDLDLQKDTIVLVSRVNGIIATDVGAISGETIVNAPLCWANLLPALWIWDRPQYQGKVNGEPTVFESTIPTSEQEKLKVKICIDDFFDTFSEDDLVKSHFGWSWVDSSEYEIPGEILELGLKF